MGKGRERKRRKGEEERGRQRKGVGLHFKSGGRGSVHVDVGECT